jgi:hypothetical protein
MTMSQIDWDEQVQVRNLNPDFIKWDGIGLAEAVRRWKTLSSVERGQLTIFAASGAYSGGEIEALFKSLPYSK